VEKSGTWFGNDQGSRQVADGAKCSDDLSALTKADPFVDVVAPSGQLYKRSLHSPPSINMAPAINLEKLCMFCLK
jgi:hypothetical protein